MNKRRAKSGHCPAVADNVHSAARQSHRHRSSVLFGIVPLVALQRTTDVLISVVLDGQTLLGTPSDNGSPRATTAWAMRGGQATIADSAVPAVISATSSNSTSATRPAVMPASALRRTCSSRQLFAHARLALEDVDELEIIDIPDWGNEQHWCDRYIHS